ncbi:MAG: hypothetical protein ACFFDN_09245 [Candidatus Hodarchaeota archaeon]
MLTPEQEIESYQKLFNYLTKGELDDCRIEHRFPIRLTPEQANSLIYVLEEVLQLHQNDVDMELCSNCKDLGDRFFDTIELCNKCEKWFCKACETLNYCEQCNETFCSECVDYCYECLNCSEHCQCDKLI